MTQNVRACLDQLTKDNIFLGAVIYDGTKNHVTEALREAIYTLGILSTYDYTKKVSTYNYRSKDLSGNPEDLSGNPDFIQVQAAKTCTKFTEAANKIMNRIESERSLLRLRDLSTTPYMRVN